MASFNRVFIGSLPTVGPRKYVVRLPYNNTPTSSHLNYSSIRTTMTTIDMKSNFQQVYDTLKYELLHDPSFVFDDDSRQWVEKMIDHNVPGGKMVRAFSVVDSYRLLKGEQLTDNEVFLACALGWSIEWLQAYLLVQDDIMDGSNTRRGQPCWFRLPEVGMTAVNDSAILRSHVFRILKKYFQKKSYYVHLLDLFNEVEFQTISGQMIDAIATHNVGEKDLSKYTLSLNRRILAYKSSYYSMYLPVACAFLMFGENLDDHIQMKDILVELGIYYQAQNDYLDTFGDPDVFGKIGTDIEEHKCSWLVAKALELANKEQKKILNENYGIKDPTCVASVKDLYHTLNLEGAYEDYENKTYEELVKSIEAYPNKVLQAVMKSCLRKIYRKHI